MAGQIRFVPIVLTTLTAGGAAAGLVTPVVYQLLAPPTGEAPVGDLVTAEA